MLTYVTRMELIESAKKHNISYYRRKKIYEAHLDRIMNSEDCPAKRPDGFGRSRKRK